MILNHKKAEQLLNLSVQINNGFTDTSADGAALAFDKKYGIMFCAYMPGPQGHYGESRGRIALSYFPASQPTNIKFVDIAVGRSVYCSNIIGLGDGKVRVLYEENSRGDCDHFVCYKDYDFLSDSLSDEKIVMLKKDDGKLVPLTGSEQFDYLEKNGFFNHQYCPSEQIAVGSHTIFEADDGYCYGAITSYLAEPILYRSKDSHWGIIRTRFRNTNFRYNFVKILGNMFNIPCVFSSFYHKICCF